MVFQTRWTLSYLRGPLSRDQIRSLTPQREAAVRASRQLPPARKPGGHHAEAPAAGSKPAGVGADRAARHPAVLRAGRGRRPVHYTPVVLGAARVGFGDAKLGIDEVRDVVYAAPFGSGALAVDWATAITLDVATARPSRHGGPAGATYAEVPSAGLQAKNYAAVEQGLWPVAVAVREARADAPPRSEADLESWRERARLSDSGARCATGRPGRRCRRGAEEVCGQAGADRRTAAGAPRRAVERESAQASQQKLQTGLVGGRDDSRGASSAARP